MHPSRKIFQDALASADLGEDPAVTVPSPSDSFVSFIPSRTRDAPKAEKAGRGFPRSYRPPRLPGFAPAGRVEASFSAVVQAGVSNLEKLFASVGPSPAESELDSGHLSPGHPTPFWKRPSSVPDLQARLPLPGTLGRARHPSFSAQSRLRPASRLSSLPTRQPGELTGSQGWDEPSDFLCQGFISPFSSTHWPCRIRDCAPWPTHPPEPPPTPENLPA